LLAARLDQLPREERVVLERGAVEGKEFHRDAVVALAPEERDADACLTTLVHKDLIRPERATVPGEDAYRFRHLLIRDAAYDALPKAVRAELHQRFAAWLEERGGDLVEREEIVGYHLEQAARCKAELGEQDPELGARAAEQLSEAGRRALARGDVDAAASLLGRAVALLPPVTHGGQGSCCDWRSATSTGRRAAGPPARPGSSVRSYTPAAAPTFVRSTPSSLR
jgi:predicted ATPase